MPCPGVLLSLQVLLDARWASRGDRARGLRRHLAKWLQPHLCEWPTTSSGLAGNLCERLQRHFTEANQLARSGALLESRGNVHAPAAIDRQTQSASETSGPQPQRDEAVETLRIDRTSHTSKCSTSSDTSLAVQASGSSTEIASASMPGSCTNKVQQPLWESCSGIPAASAAIDPLNIKMHSSPWGSDSSSTAFTTSTDSLDSETQQSPWVLPQQSSQTQQQTSHASSDQVILSLNLPPSRSNVWCSPPAKQRDDTGTAATTTSAMPQHHRYLHTPQQPLTPQQPDVACGTRNFAEKADTDTATEHDTDIDTDTDCDTLTGRWQQCTQDQVKHWQPQKQLSEQQQTQRQDWQLQPAHQPKVCHVQSQQDPLCFTNVWKLSPCKAMQQPEPQKQGERVAEKHRRISSDLVLFQKLSNLPRVHGQQ
eukprot:TRINITY_DN11289_c0_g1_i1.p1 TRINITY_DN11289_c0_g1~~TRINITY_DN11289_c0_g1_i1.p1  ORF type:complete len:424 (+),score=75.69 TRINITY_DN11289_c0_g1_i1:57-1328(+)